MVRYKAYLNRIVQCPADIISPAICSLESTYELRENLLPGLYIVHALRKHHCCKCILAVSNGIWDGLGIRVELGSYAYLLVFVDEL